MIWIGIFVGYVIMAAFIANGAYTYRTFKGTDFDSAADYALFAGLFWPMIVLYLIFYWPIKQILRFQTWAIKEIVDPQNNVKEVQ